MKVLPNVPEGELQPLGHTTVTIPVVGKYAEVLREVAGATMLQLNQFMFPPMFDWTYETTFEWQLRTFPHTLGFLNSDALTELVRIAKRVRFGMYVHLVTPTEFCVVLKGGHVSMCTVYPASKWFEVLQNQFVILLVFEPYTHFGKTKFTRQ